MASIQQECNHTSFRQESKCQKGKSIEGSGRSHDADLVGEAGNEAEHDGEDPHGGKDGLLAQGGEGVGPDDPVLVSLLDVGRQVGVLPCQHH